MGKVNVFLQDKLEGKEDPVLPENLHFIVEVEADEQIPEVLNKLNLLSGIGIKESSLNFIHIIAPPQLVDKIAQIPGVRVVSYNSPVYIRSSPSITDPLLGIVQLSAITIPSKPTEALLSLPSKLAYIPLGLLSLAIPKLFSAAQIKAPNIIITPTGITREWMGMPEDNIILKTPVADIDTGLTYPHPLFHPTKGLIKLFSVTGEPPFDGLGHGEWTSTCAWGDSFNTRFGLCRGIADPENGLLISIKALSNLGFGSSFGIIKAMEIAWKAGAKVVNMSLGGPLQGGVQEDPECRAIEKLKNDVIFVVAAGNDGPKDWTIGSPGASPFALTVGAWSVVYDGLAIFSSRGPSADFYKSHPAIWKTDFEKYGEDLIKPDVLAPGGGPVEDGQPIDTIYSGVTGWTDGTNDLTPGDGFDSMRGTSMATPHVAGLVSYAVDRGILSTAAEIKQVLAAHSTKDSEKGYGLINLSKITQK